MKKLKEQEEVHMRGLLTIENPIQEGGIVEDFGIQIAEDGRVWICVGNRAFIRFKPLEEKFLESFEVEE